jgi:hypothetical protein
MDEAVDSPTEIVSTVSDLREVPLSALADRTTPEVDRALDRVLDLEANGLLTVASFNAAI